MPGLTVAEKNHWKDRLSKRIDRRIETIAAEEPNLLDRVKRDARARAMQSLNVAELQADVDAIEQQEETLDKRKGLLHRTMLSRVRRVPLETIDQPSQRVTSQLTEQTPLNARQFARITNQSTSLWANQGDRMRTT